MGRYDRVAETFGYRPPAPGQRRSGDEVADLLTMARSKDARTRQVAVKNLCTCHLRADDARVWEVLLDLFADEDPRVRRDALHGLTDSTPTTRIPTVVSALEARYADPDLNLRRRIRKTLGHYRRTGAITDSP